MLVAKVLKFAIVVAVSDDVVYLWSRHNPAVVEAFVLEGGLLVPLVEVKETGRCQR